MKPTAQDCQNFPFIKPLVKELRVVSLIKDCAIWNIAAVQTVAAIIGRPTFTKTQLYENLCIVALIPVVVFLFVISGLPKLNQVKIPTLVGTRSRFVVKAALIRYTVTKTTEIDVQIATCDTSNQRAATPRVRTWSYNNGTRDKTLNMVLQDLNTQRIVYARGDAEKYAACLDYMRSQATLEGAVFGSWADVCLPDLEQFTLQDIEQYPALSYFCERQTRLMQWMEKRRFSEFAGYKFVVLAVKINDGSTAHVMAYNTANALSGEWHYPETLDRNSCFVVVKSVHSGQVFSLKRPIGQSVRLIGHLKAQTALEGRLLLTKETV